MSTVIKLGVWIPFTPNNYKKLDELFKDKKVQVKFDSGEVLNYDDDNWPMAIVTHIRALH